jgi:hypothetical protein
LGFGSTFVGKWWDWEIGLLKVIHVKILFGSDDTAFWLLFWEFSRISGLVGA